MHEQTGQKKVHKKFLDRAKRENSSSNMKNKKKTSLRSQRTSDGGENTMCTKARSHNNIQEGKNDEISNVMLSVRFPYTLAGSADRFSYTKCMGKRSGNALVLLCISVAWRKFSFVQGSMTKHFLKKYTMGNLSEEI